jgi:hypothetical protein
MSHPFWHLSQSWAFMCKHPRADAQPSRSPTLSRSPPPLPLAPAPFCIPVPLPRLKRPNPSCRCWLFPRSSSLLPHRWVPILSWSEPLIFLRCTNKSIDLSLSVFSMAFPRSVRLDFRCHHHAMLGDWSTLPSLTSDLGSQPIAMVVWQVLLLYDSLLSRQLISKSWWKCRWFRFYVQRHVLYVTWSTRNVSKAFVYSTNIW